MNKLVSGSVLALLALACLTWPAAAQTAPQAAVKDKPVDMKALIAEIAGDYEFSAGGEILTLQLVEQDGKLFGAPPGETPEEIQPVEGKPLCFGVTVSANGQYYEMQFARNDQGVIDRCVLTVMGMVIEGMKIKK